MIVQLADVFVYVSADIVPDEHVGPPLVLEICEHHEIKGLFEDYKHQTEELGLQ